MEILGAGMCELDLICKFVIADFVYFQILLGYHLHKRVS